MALKFDELNLNHLPEENLLLITINEKDGISLNYRQVQELSNWINDLSRRMERQELERPPAYRHDPYPNPYQPARLGQVAAAPAMVNDVANWVVHNGQGD